MNDERSPDLTQALLLELRAQVEEARRERDEARQSSEYLHARWAETAARADGLDEQLAEARRERDEAREKARVSDLMLRLELADRKNEAASYANAIGRIESVLGMAGAGPLRETVRAVDDVVKHLADARLSAEQGAKVAEALAAEKSALASRVAVLEAALRGLADRSTPANVGRASWGAAMEAARRALDVEP